VSLTSRSRVSRIILAGASALILVLSVTGWAASTRYLSGLSTVNVFGGLAGTSAWSGEAMNVLVVGSDDRAGLTRKQRQRTHIERTDAGRHTDTMLLVHLGGDLGQMSVVSIPRDSLVTIPEHTSPEGEHVPEHQGKINSAFATGGPAVTVQTVQNATGLTIDHYIEINFGGFLKMVDAVGGVEVCLPEPLQDQRARLDLPAGRQTIQGPDALAYVRARYIDNDFGRSQRQQKFLAAMAQKVFSTGVLLNPVALNSFVDSVVSSVTTDERLTRDEMAAFAARAADMDLSNIEFTTIPVSDGNHMVDGESTVLWDAPAAQALFEALRQDQPLPKEPKTAVVEVSPGEISVVVSGASDNVARAVADMNEAGYQVTTGQTTPASTPSQSPGSPAPSTTTTVRYDPALPDSLKTLRAALPHATFEAAPGIGQTFQLSVGSDYDGIVPVRSATTSMESTIRSAKDNLCS
jgi:LCP family protein required for cell wall assembly